jgi:hypothetical protein
VIDQLGARGLSATGADPEECLSDACFGTNDGLKTDIAPSLKSAKG